MKRDYIPRDNGKLVIWLTNFKTQITTIGVTLGLTLIEITNLKNAAQQMIDSLNLQETTKQAAQQQTSATIAEKKTGLNLVRRESQRMKNHSAYTEALGEGLGIVGDEHVVDIANSKPTLQLQKQPFGVQINFSLLGFFSSVHIYKKRTTDAAFIFLANDTATPYIDNSPTDTGTRYYAYFVDHDVEVGLRSDEAVL